MADGNPARVGLCALRCAIVFVSLFVVEAPLEHVAGIDWIFAVVEDGCKTADREREEFVHLRPGTVVNRPHRLGPSDARKVKVARIVLSEACAAADDWRRGFGGNVASERGVAVLS